MAKMPKRRKDKYNPNVINLRKDRFKKSVFFDTIKKVKRW